MRRLAGQGSEIMSQPKRPNIEQIISLLDVEVEDEWDVQVREAVTDLIDYVNQLEKPPAPPNIHAATFLTAIARQAAPNSDEEVDAALAVDLIEQGDQPLENWPAARMFVTRILKRHNYQPWSPDGGDG